MDAVQQTLNSMMEHFNTRMEAFETNLQKANTAPLTISSLAADFAEFRSLITSTLGNLQQQVKLLAHQMDHFEMRSRRKILLVHGVKEVGGDNSIHDLVRIVKNVLQVPGFSEGDISRSHRLGRVTTDKPRPILVKFNTVNIRDKIWYAKTGLRDSGITISEFLTKERHEAFMAARKRFGLKKCWTRDGFVMIVGEDGSRYRISTIDEVNKVVNPAPTTTAGSQEISSGNSTDKKTTVGTVPRPKRATKK
ncbi:uncharacterized protein ACR2FA_004596 [Aphomia sociella]